MNLLEKLLFKLHITNNLTIRRMPNGEAAVTIHRTDSKSSVIKPDLTRIK